MRQLKRAKKSNKSQLFLVFIILIIWGLKKLVKKLVKKLNRTDLLFYAHAHVHKDDKKKAKFYFIAEKYEFIKYGRKIVTA